MSDIGSKYGHDPVVILLDECGDLGRSPHSSRHFVVAAMAIRDTDGLVRLTKNARKKLGKRDWRGELKFNNTVDPIRAFIMECVAQMDCQIAWVSFEKGELASALLNDEKLLYPTACETVLGELFRRTSAKRMHIIRSLAGKPTFSKVG